MIRRYMDSADRTAAGGTNTTEIPIYEGEILLSIVVGSTESVTIDVAYHQGGNAESAITLIAQETCVAGRAVFALIPLDDRRVHRGTIHVAWYGCNAAETLNAHIGVGARNAK